MSLAVRGNVRTAAAAAAAVSCPAPRRSPSGRAPSPACSASAWGCWAPTVIVFLFQNTATAVLVGFGFGASLIALFMRVGGGIFTKAGRRGSRPGGQGGGGHPRGRPRNAATIADNVGDNVGDCAGMAADLFESDVITIVAAIILGLRRLRLPGGSLAADSARAVMFPLIVPAIGIVASAIGVYVVRARPRTSRPWPPINRGFWTAAALTVAGAGLVAGFYLHYMKAFYAVLTGVVLALVASQITEHFTSTERPPSARSPGGAHRPGHDACCRIAFGLESTVWAILAIAVAMGVGPAGPRQRRATCST